MHNMTKVWQLHLNSLFLLACIFMSIEDLWKVCSTKVACKAQHQHLVAVTWETRGFPLLPHYHEGRTDESSVSFFCAVSQGFTQSFLLTAHWPGLITCPNCWVGSLVNGKLFGHRVSTAECQSGTPDCAPTKHRRQNSLSVSVHDI